MSTGALHIHTATEPWLLYFLNSTHLHITDDIVLTQVHDLVVNEVNHDQVTDNLSSLTILSNLEATHLHVADNVNIQQLLQGLKNKHLHNTRTRQPLFDEIKLIYDPWSVGIADSVLQEFNCESFGGFSAEVILPNAVVESSGITGSVGTFDEILLPFTVTGYFGGNFSGQFLNFDCNATGLTGINGVAEIVLSLQVNAAGIQHIIGHADVVLNQITVNVNGYSGSISSGSFVLPTINIWGQGLTGQVGVSELISENMTVTGNGFSNISGKVNIVLPQLEMSENFVFVTDLDPVLRYDEWR